MHLIDWLVERQVELGMDDNAFADHLGVSRSLWSLLRRGLRTPSDWFRMRVLEAFPAQCQLILGLDSDQPRVVA